MLAGLSAMALGQHFAVWSESSNCKDAFMAVTATIPRQRTELLTSWVGALIAFLSNRFPRLSATGCALYGASLFFVCAKKSKQKKAPPDIRPRLRRGYSLRSPFGPACGCYFAALRFAPSIIAPRVGVQGPSMDLYAFRGHPGRSSLCATIPLALLARGVWRAFSLTVKTKL